MDNKYVEDHSSLIIGRLTKKEIKELFGKDNPTISERAKICYEQWVAWKEHGISIRSDKEHITRKILAQNGYKNFKDYVIIGRELRFPNREDAIWFRLMADSEVVE
jgi:hypothetical protein